MGVAFILIFMFIGYILHYKSDKEITYIKIASIWSDLVARGMFISLIKSRSLGGIFSVGYQTTKFNFEFLYVKFYSCKNLEIFAFKNGILALKLLSTFWIHLRGDPWDGSKSHWRRCCHVRVTLRWPKIWTVQFLIDFSSKYPSRVKTLRWLIF